MWRHYELGTLEGYIYKPLATLLTFSRDDAVDLIAFTNFRLSEDEELVGDQTVVPVCQLLLMQEKDLASTVRLPLTGVSKADGSLLCL